ncbi:isocitrate lyase/PEP mutase family protein [Adonisia turfae]|uniref:Isocitrate lyase/phosphoenolpyruvate mutase family protein n=1 Tax=Adonisia turfae CCMR0081 TaxID=2292702 RepID=A0A6M0RSX5_9CYAN|nr:isocitrate lyase/phosphoenolpyruvate mutase family protein [Adonisia turfae]NEZ59266.1 isocitrate lyase/phosphoenolpyruvate mutase family protein [Adonisia turfae CCMR0081]
MSFKALHNQEHPLLLCNVWDASSAKLAEKLGFQAMGTSSAAIAATLGYADGEEIAFSELYQVVKTIQKHSTLPLTVDIESGYSRDPIEIAENIQKLAALGVEGVNIEDSIVVDGERSLVDTVVFTDCIARMLNKLQQDNIAMFLNIRSDVFLLGYDDPVAEAKSRIPHYESLGVNGIFLPCIQTPKDIEAVMQFCTLPLNVMCMPELPNFQVLQALGVKRISMGNFLFNYIHQQLENTLSSIYAKGSFSEVFNGENH